MNRRLLLSSTLLLSAIPMMARAETISNFNATVTTASASEVARPYRSGVQQTWLGAESYMGVNSSTTTSTFYYNVYTFSAALFTGAPYVEITAFDPQSAGNDFVVAYAGSYNPGPSGPYTTADSTARGMNWLGDEGASGNYFGTTDGRYFDVVLPVGQDLVIWVGNTAVGLGLNDPINIEVDAYADTDYDDPVAVTPPTTVTPEPSSFITLGTGLVSVFGVARRRLRKA